MGGISQRSANVNVCSVLLKVSRKRSCLFLQVRKMSDGFNILKSRKPLVALGIAMANRQPEEPDRMKALFVTFADAGRRRSLT
ncbi:hypothetical protein C8R44DRAFT_847100, partial [Mycena epipterygia]